MPYFYNAYIKFIYKKINFQFNILKIKKVKLYNNKKWNCINS